MAHNQPYKPNLSLQNIKREASTLWEIDLTEIQVEARLWVRSGTPLPSVKDSEKSRHAVRTIFLSAKVISEHWSLPTRDDLLFSNSILIVNQTMLLNSITHPDQILSHLAGKFLSYQALPML